MKEDWGFQGVCLGVDGLFSCLRIEQPDRAGCDKGDSPYGYNRTSFAEESED
jgi:hypothetical protein